MSTHRTSRFSGTTALSALALLGAGFAAAVVPLTPASAQDYTNATASGRVVGASGEPISGATVELRSDDQGFVRTTTTDSSGSYRIPQIPQGSYTFTVSAPGFGTYTEQGVAVNQGAGANQFSLVPTTGTATASSGDIVVTGRRTRVVDFDRNVTGAVINIGELQTRVPVARDITSVVLLSPGTAAGDTAFGNLPSVNGASVSENTYYINGLNITQFRNGLGSVPVPFDFYQTVEVKNGGFSAEFGRTTGGVVNAVTKSGSNEFHGGLLFNFEPDALYKDRPNAYSDDNDNDYRQRTDTIVQLSGPIIKDRLFFYGLYNFRDVQVNDGFTSVLGATAAQCGTAAAIASTTGTYKNFCLTGSQYRKDRSTSPFFGGKLDGIIADGHRVEFTYFDTSGVTRRQIFGTSVFPATAGRYNPSTNDPGRYVTGTNFRSGGENYVGRYTGTFAKWLTVSGAYGVNKNRDTTESATANLASIVDQRSGASQSIGNPTANSSVNFDKREFYRGDVDVYFRMFGEHHIRGGYDRENLSERSSTFANGNFQYTYSRTAAGSIDAATGLPGGTDYVVARTFVNGGTFTSRNEAYYIQDSWTLFNNRLNLNIGVRNDRFENKNGVGQTFFKSGDQWGPRLSASFDVLGDGRTKVYGNYGRYFLPVAVNTNIRLAGSELDYDRYFRLTGLNSDNSPILGAAVLIPNADICPGTSSASCVIRNDGTTPGTESTVASNLKPQSADEFILGADQRIGTRIKVGVFGTYRKLNDSLEDAALDPAIRTYCVAQGKTAAACSAVWNGVHQYALVNPGRDVSITLSDPLPGETQLRTVTLPASDLGYPKARRTYKAVTFTFDREFDGVWSVSGSYTYSKGRGNIEGGIRSDNGQTDSGLTTAFDLPALVNGAYGYLPNDVRHNFKLYGSYAPAKWVNIGLNAFIQSPRRYGCLGRVPAQADNNLAGRFYGAAGFYCNLNASGQVITDPTFAVVNPLPGAAGTPSLQLTPRGSQFKSDWLYQLNSDIAIKVPVSTFDATLRVSVFNILNRKAKIDFQEVGTLTSGAPNTVYGQPTVFQTPRYFRFQLGVNF